MIDGPSGDVLLAGPTAVVRGVALVLPYTAAENNNN